MTPTRNIFIVTETIEGAHFSLDYPLLSGDYITEQDDGTFTKFAPGLGIGGFTLTDAQRATLTPVVAEDVPPIKIVGMAEYLSGGSA